MSDILMFPGQPELPTIHDALAVVDVLRADLLSGKIKAFCGVGISVDHSSYCYQGMSQPTSRLEIMGGLSWLWNGIQNNRDVDA